MLIKIHQICWANEGWAIDGDGAAVEAGHGGTELDEDELDCCCCCWALFFLYVVGEWFSQGQTSSAGFCGPK